MSTPLRRAAHFSTLLLVSAMLVGCGADPKMPKLGKVTGKVSLNGKPVQGGHITFTPEPGQGGDTGQTATGEIDADGSYFMTTFSTGDGAILGKHIVTVEVREKDAKMPQPKPDGTIDYVLPKSLSPKKYSNPSESPLRITVREGSQDFPIELKN